MEYRVSGNRCAVILNLLNLPISNEEALKILYSKGFEKIDVDIIELAKRCIRTSQYKRGVKISEAPAILDCSSFMKYLYAKLGIWLPRRSIQQREFGEIINLNEIIAGDLVFISGHIDYFIDDPLDGVGHVGIATGNGTVIHAANKKSNIIETPLGKFIDKDSFRGARRYLPKGEVVITFNIPISRDVEFTDDLKWIILQSLPKN